MLWHGFNDRDSLRSIACCHSITLNVKKKTQSNFKSYVQWRDVRFNADYELQRSSVFADGLDCTSRNSSKFVQNLTQTGSSVILVQSLTQTGSNVQVLGMDATGEETTCCSHSSVQENCSRILKQPAALTVLCRKTVLEQLFAAMKQQCLQQDPQLSMLTEDDDGVCLKPIKKHDKTTLAPSTSPSSN